MKQDVGTTTHDWHPQHLHGAPHIQPLDVLGMIRVLWHGKWLIVLATVAMILLAGFYAFRLASPQYMANATVQLDRVSANTRQSAVTTTDETSLNTVVAQVTSDAVLTQIITAMDLLNDPEFNRYLNPQNPFSTANWRTKLRHAIAGTQEPIRDAGYILEKTIQNLRGSLSVARQKDTYILQISARSGNSAKATTLANTTAALFLAHLEALQEQSRAEAEVWLQARVTDLRQQLETTETAAAKLIATAQIQEDSVLDQLSAEVLATEQQLGTSRTALAVLETSAGRSNVRTVAEIAQLQTTIGDLAARKDRLSAQLSTQSAGLAQLHQIQLQADTTRQLYQTFLGRLQENKMQQSLRAPNAQTIAPAADGQYIGPRKILILTIAAMLGATAGVALVAVLHSTKHGVIDAKTLRDATGLPVLVQLSHRIMRPVQKGKRALPLSPHAPLLQAMHGLNTALSLAIRGTPAQIILCTASIQGEGASEQALALTHALASAGKSVIIIGANDRSQVLQSQIDPAVFQQASKNWPVPDTKAFDSYLGADVLAVGKDNGRNGTLLTDQVAEVLQTLRQSYNHIIVDGPAVLLAPEARLFARHADAILYSVRWSKTPLQVVIRGLEALEDNGSAATGLVLTKVNLRKMRKLSTDPCIGAIRTAQAI